MKYVVEYGCPYNGSKHDKWESNSDIELYQFLQHHPNYRMVYRAIDMMEFNNLGRVVKLSKWLSEHGYHAKTLAIDILKVLGEG